MCIRDSHEGEADDRIDLDAHELAGLEILGGSPHGKAYLGLVDKYLKRHNKGYHQEGRYDGDPFGAGAVDNHGLAEERQPGIALGQTAGIICSKVLDKETDAYCAYHYGHRCV